jgi:integrase
VQRSHGYAAAEWRVAAAAIARKGRSDNTRRIYEGALRKAQAHLLPADSTNKVLQLFTPLAGSHWSAVAALRGAVAAWHRDRQLPAPAFNKEALHDFWRGLQRSCDNTVRGKTAVTPQQIQLLTDMWIKEGTRVGLRNATIAVLQFITMKRGSEVLRLAKSDIRDDGPGRGLTITFRRQKNDQVGRGLKIPIPERTLKGMPVGFLLRVYLAAAAPGIPPLFQSASSCSPNALWREDPTPLPLNTWTKALRQGLLRIDPTLKPSISDYASHSLRKGGFTAAAMAGIPHDCAIATIGHKPNTLSWLRYLIRPAEDQRAALSRIA